MVYEVYFRELLLLKFVTYHLIPFILVFMNSSRDQYVTFQLFASILQLLIFISINNSSQTEGKFLVLQLSLLEDWEEWLIGVLLIPLMLLNLYCNHNLLHYLKENTSMFFSIDQLQSTDSE